MGKKKEEWIDIPREKMWEAFSKGADDISKDLINFFGEEKDMADDIKKDVKLLKEQLLNTVDEIHKQILLINYEVIKEKERKKKEQEKLEKMSVEKVAKKVGGSSFWD